MAELQIRMDAIRSNIRQLRSGIAPTCRVMFVCQSDFYGLGLHVAAGLEPWIDLFAVGAMSEALSLWDLTTSKDIVVLHPPTERDALLELLAVSRSPGRP